MRHTWYLFLRFIRIDFREWFAEHCPVHIPNKKPPTPTRHCEYCDKPLNKIIAFDTGDGFALEWTCENECGDSESIDNWWPFWFGAWANDKRFAKIGIEVV